MSLAMNRTSQLGFTLIELMVVLAIAVVLTGGAFSGWQHWQQIQRLEESSRQVQQFLLRLRSWANWHNSGQSVWLIDGNPGCLGSGKKPESCVASQRMQLVLPYADVVISKIVGEPGFYGVRNTAKAGHLELSGKAGTRRIIISAFGRIRQCQPQEENCQ